MLVWHPAQPHKSSCIVIINYGRLPARGFCSGMRKEPLTNAGYRVIQEPLQTRINLHDPLSVYIPSSIFLRSSVYYRVTYRDLGSDNTWLKSVVPFSTPVISGNPDFSNSIYPITDDTHRRGTAVVHFRWTSGSLKHQPRDH